MHDRYIIVIYVAAVPGGVFIEEPESYTIEYGQIKRMSFKSWKKRLLSANSDERMVLNQLIAASHEPASKKYSKFWDYLRRLRLDGDWRTFESFTKKALESKIPKIESILAFEKTLAACMRKDYQNAERYTSQFCRHTENPNYKVEETYLRAVLCNSMDDHDGYFLCNEGLDAAKKLNDSVFMVRFYCLAANITATRAVEEHNLDYRDEAKGFIKQALDMSKTMYRNPNNYSDFQQIVYIHMTFLSLNSSIKLLDNHTTPEIDQIQKAQEFLTSAKRPHIGTRRISQYNKCMYLLAESDFYYRCFQAAPACKSVHIQSAHESASEARDIAERYTFQGLFEYASARESSLTEQLLQFRWNGTLSEQKAILEELIEPER